MNEITMRTTMIKKFALFALLTGFVGGCQKQNKTGEAFVVLKSGDIAYMADMELACLKPNFKNDFNSWRIAYLRESKSLTHEIENTISKEITELRGSEKRTIEQQKAILAETIQSINAYIKESSLPIPWLNLRNIEDSRHNLFKDSEDNLFEKVSALSTEFDRPLNAGLLDLRADVKNSFLVETLKHKESENQFYEWEFYTHIPRQIEGSPIETAVRKAGDNWEHLCAKRIELQSSIVMAEDRAQKKSGKLKERFRAQFYELVKRNLAVTLRTGSKGDFIAPPETAYIYAETQRGNGEKIGWLVTVDPKSPKIKMSVSNAASAGEHGNFDDFWMLQLHLAD